MTSKLDTPEDSITSHLEKEYRNYLAAQDRGDVAAVEAYLSPSCWQIARQDPSWNLNDRADIMRILVSLGLGTGPKKDRDPDSVHVRLLTEEEKESIPEKDKEKAAREGWEGLHVELWDNDPKDFLVKVNYWWSKEGDAWLQRLHDLLWVGPSDEKKAHEIGAVIFGSKPSD